MMRVFETIFETVGLGIALALGVGALLIAGYAALFILSQGVI